MKLFGTNDEINESIDEISEELNFPMKSLEEIEKELESKNLNEIAPTVGAPPLNNDVVERIIVRLAHRCYLTPALAFAAITLLFLKGAASKTAPDKMFVEVVAVDGKLLKVTKGDLMQVLYDCTGNRFIRRLAESLAVSISKFAERHGLKGDLAFNFDIEEVSKGNPPLTDKEKAWSSSFCQYVTDLETLASPRVKLLLGQDYQKRFDKKKKQKKKKEERKSSKAKGGAKPSVSSDN
jgi:hypothetical protein